jgi:hypothetical protein
LACRARCARSFFPAEGYQRNPYLDCGNRTAFASGDALIEAHPDFGPSTGPTFVYRGMSAETWDTPQFDKGVARRVFDASLLSRLTSTHLFAGAGGESHNDVAFEEDADQD